MRGAVGSRRWLLRIAAVSVLVGVVIVASSVASREAPVGRRIEVPPRGSVVRDQPPSVAKPVHLASTYVAPKQQRVRPAGHLAIARLGIVVPVVQVGWDRQAVAVPDDPATAGWFAPSAWMEDRAGVSLIAGHVSDRQDRAGPLARLVNARVGDFIEWTSAGMRARFQVVSIGRYPRASGLPVSLFRVDGPHLLRLVTCTDRRSGVFGFHYADNLVVSAREVSP